MSHLRVVLVEPQIPANLGFVARVLANFGVEDWVAVGGCPVKGTEAERTGSPAPEQLAALRRADSLDEALDGCVGAIGFTARGGHRRPPVNLECIREEAAARGLTASSAGESDSADSTKGDVRPIALVFGREDRGLEARECEACSLLVTIPTDGFGSLNLSHAVAVGLYEWFRGERHVPETVLDHQWSSAEERRFTADRVVRLLDAVEFPHHEDQLHGLLRRLVAQPMESRDLRVLNKILRHVEYRRDVDPSSSD